MVRGMKFEIKAVEELCYLCRNKRGGLISCAITMQLIRAFVIAYAKSGFWVNQQNKGVDEPSFQCSFSMQPDQNLDCSHMSKSKKYNHHANMSM